MTLDLKFPRVGIGFLKQADHKAQFAKVSLLKSKGNVRDFNII